MLVVLHLHLLFFVSIFISFILSISSSFLFFFNDPAPTEIYTLSLHDALPILSMISCSNSELTTSRISWRFSATCCACCLQKRDRKSTRLNSSHLGISYAVFCLKKKTKKYKKKSYYKKKK